MVDELPRHDGARIMAAAVRMYAAMTDEERALLGLSDEDSEYMEQGVIRLLSPVRWARETEEYAPSRGPEGHGLAAIAAWEASFAERPDDAERRRARERAITARDRALMWSAI